MAVLAILVGLLALGVVYQRVGLWRDRRTLTPPGVLLDVGGHRLHVLCRGSGAPAVLLESGVAASSVSWTSVQSAIAPMTRVCAYDRAGLAWSDPPGSPRTFDRILDELDRVLDHVAGRDRAVLVGHSFGSFVVRGYAARHPGRVAGLVLVDPPTEWLAPGERHARLLWGGRHLSRVGALLAHVGVVRGCLALLTGGAPGAPRRFVRIFGPTAARTLERLVGEVRKLPPEVHPVVQALWCQPRCFHAIADHLRVLERDVAAIAACAPPSGIPVIVISGGAQDAAMLAAHRALAERSSRGRHVVAERSAHWVPYDEPDVIAAAARELVHAARARSGADGAAAPDGA